MAQIIKSSTSDVTSEHPPMPATMPSPPIANANANVNAGADLVKSATGVGEGIDNAAHANVSSYRSNTGAKEEENDHADDSHDESSWEDDNRCF